MFCTPHLWDQLPVSFCRSPYQSSSHLPHFTHGSSSSFTLLNSFCSSLSPKTYLFHRSFAPAAVVYGDNTKWVRLSDRAGISRRSKEKNFVIFSNSCQVCSLSMALSWLISHSKISEGLHYPSKQNSSYELFWFFHYIFSFFFTALVVHHHHDHPVTTVLTHYSPMAWLGTKSDQPNSREKMRDFTVELLKCAKFNGKFTEGVWEIHKKFTGPTAVISRCYANAN